MGLLASHIAPVTRVPPLRNYSTSTPAAGISPLTSLVFIVFPNALSAPSVPPSDPSFHYFVVDTTSSTARVNPTTTSSTLHPVTSSDQSQSTTSPTSMTSTTMATSVASSSASPPVLSASTPEISTGFSSMSSSTHAVTSVVSSSTNATTSTPTSSVQSTTPPSPTTSSSPTTGPSSTTFSPHMTTSSPSTSIHPSTSNTSFSVASSPPSSSPMSPRTSPTNTNIPVTTVLVSTTLFITSTNSVGEMITGAPPVVTEVITTTGSGGIATTVTQAVVNPTLAQDNNATGTSSFFDNTGAVVGVFVVVGLASASIMLWILFAIRRRQRLRRIQDDALEAAVAAAGLNRAPLDDDNEDGSPVSPQARRRLSSGMGQRGSLLGYGSGGSDSLLTSARASEPFEDLRNSSHADYHPSGHSEGYAPARTTSPAQRIERPMPSGSNDYGSSRERKSSYGHTPTYSAGSFEPLLANYRQNTTEQDSPTPPTPLPRDSQQLIDASPRRSASSLPHDSHGNSLDESAEDRSETGIKGRSSSDSSGSVRLRDNGEHSRPVLVVRNVPDSPSEHSV